MLFRSGAVGVNHPRPESSSSTTNNTLHLPFNQPHCCWFLGDAVHNPTHLEYLSHSFLCYLIYTCTYTCTYTHALTHMHSHTLHMHFHTLPSQAQSRLSLCLVPCLLRKWVLLMAKGFSYAKLSPKGMNVIRPNPFHP